MINASNVIGILQVGMHATALVFLYLGYRLMNRVIGQKASDKNPDTKILDMILKNIKTFIIFSLIFFIVGAGIELISRIISPQITISAAISPEVVPEYLSMPEISIDGKLLTWEQGTSKPRLSGTSVLKVSTDKLVECGRKQNLIMRESNNAAVSKKSDGKLSNEGGL